MKTKEEHEIQSEVDVGSYQASTRSMFLYSENGWKIRLLEGYAKTTHGGL